MLPTLRLSSTIRHGPHKKISIQAPRRTRAVLFPFNLPHRTVSTQPPMGENIHAVSTPTPSFPVSPMPKNHLGEGRYIRTAAALIIGDEILNGKTLDMNSNYFAKYCFEHGVDLKRIEVIADDEDQMVRDDLIRLSKTSHVFCKDITYASLAKAFSQSLAHHPETLARMAQMIQRRTWTTAQTPQQRAATERMALFPDRAEIIFVAQDLWVPVVRLEDKLCIFPGIPSLFQKMLNALTPFLPLPPRAERPLRIQVFTERPESMIAPYLTNLQSRLRPHGIQVGSYPVLGQGVFVSLIGRDRPPTTTTKTSSGQDPKFSVGELSGNGRQNGPPRIWLAEVALEVEREVGGQVVSEEEVAKMKDRCKGLAAPVEAAASIGLRPHATGILKAKY